LYRSDSAHKLSGQLAGEILRSPKSAELFDRANERESSVVIVFQTARAFLGRLQVADAPLARQSIAASGKPALWRRRVEPAPLRTTFPAAADFERPDVGNDQSDAELVLRAHLPKGQGGDNSTAIPQQEPL